MKELLNKLKETSLSSVLKAESPEELENLRVKYLGKKGELTSILKQMGKLSDEDRRVIGQAANSIRASLEEAFESRKNQMYEKLLDLRLKLETTDVTVPGSKMRIGKKHPVSIIIDEVKDIFIGMGFTVADGPETELAKYNFDKLNHDENHPARDRQDTFYFSEDDNILLRTSTSPVQIRVMEMRSPPIRVISPGRVYRKDEVDATHSPMFHQIEGLVVDKGITMGDLKGTLNTLIERLYGSDAKTRFRPHHFPFTEPSCEIDVQCFECGGEGCRVCKNEGWIELLGAGMVHPYVLEGCGTDSRVYSGFAFGVGVERMAMRRFNIPDLRMLYENDMRFLDQF
ncbi:MAG: phenylalanine--tRNA ligase subunit alpha [Oscillospiraceae bacterium]|nr:phenylalanine--tRNA ligase subunit alpha [Oscillospiraceae bacterium]